MQGSYILLAAVGIFLLIGGGKRILKSFNLSPVGAVSIIVLIIIANMFRPIEDGITIYSGALIIGLISLSFVLSKGIWYFLKTILASIVVVVILTLYDIYIIERFAVDVTSSIFMLTAGTAIISFIFSKNSSQSFIIATLSVILFDIVISIVRNQMIVIGDATSFDILIYASLIAVALNELVNEMIALYNDKSPNLSFEAGVIDEKEEDKNNN